MRSQASRRLGWLAIPLLLASAPGARAVHFQLFPFDAELSAFVQSYHRNPDPHAAVDRFFAMDIEAFENEAERYNQAHLGPVLMAFFVEVFQRSPDLAVPFARRSVRETTGRKAAFAAEILARGRSEKRDEALRVIAEGFQLPEEQRAKLAGLEPFLAIETEATSPQALDVLWGGFFASGDPAYLRAILEPLNRCAEPEDRWVARIEELGRQRPEPGSAEYAEYWGLVTAKAALFGLRLNAAQEPRVRQALEGFADEPGRAGEISAKILAVLRERTTGWWSGGSRWPQLDWAKSAGAFKAQLILTHDPDAFFERWKQEGDPVVTILTNRTTRGKRVEAIVIFSGCASGADGLCRALADFVIRRPDGSVYGRFDDQEVWVGKPPPMAGAIQFGVMTIGLIAEPEDPLGRYAFEVTVRDEVAGLELSLTQQLDVEEAP